MKLLVNGEIFFRFQPIKCTLKGLTVHFDLLDFNELLELIFYFSIWEYIIEKHLKAASPVSEALGILKENKMLICITK